MLFCWTLYSLNNSNEKKVSTRIIKQHNCYSNIEKCLFFIDLLSIYSMKDHDVTVQKCFNVSNKDILGWA